MLTKLKEIEYIGLTPLVARQVVETVDAKTYKDIQLAQVVVIRAENLVFEKVKKELQYY